jgi:hypothetical protein
MSIYSREEESMDAYDHDIDRLVASQADIALKLRSVSRPLFVIYPEAEEVLAALEYRLTHAPDRRPRHMAVSCPLDNGLGTILLRFMQCHPAFTVQRLECRLIPVVSFHFPIVATLTAFCASIADAVGYEIPYGCNDPSRYVMMLCRRHHVRMFIVRDARDIDDYSPIERRRLVGLLKLVSRVAGVSCVFVGQGPFVALMERLRIDGVDIYNLPLWSESRLEGFLSVLGAALPIEEGEQLPVHAHELFQITDGHLGEVVRRVRFAAMAAITKMAPRIEAEDFRGPLIRLARKQEPFA